MACSIYVLTRFIKPNYYSVFSLQCVLRAAELAKLYTSKADSFLQGFSRVFCKIFVKLDDYNAPQDKIIATWATF